MAGAAGPLRSKTRGGRKTHQTSEMEATLFPDRTHNKTGRHIWTLTQREHVSIYNVPQGSACVRAWPAARTSVLAEQTAGFRGGNIHR